jgi:hypothetical protein
MNAPELTRQQLQDEERAAERAVIEAESAWLLAQATGTASDVDAALQRLAETRLGSMHVRQRLIDGTDAWTRYAAYQEAVAHAAANVVQLTGGAS